MPLDPQTLTSLIGLIKSDLTSKTIAIGEKGTIAPIAVENMDLRNSGLVDSDLKQLANALPGTNKIKRLDISENAISTPSIIYLIEKATSKKVGEESSLLSLTIDNRPEQELQRIRKSIKGTSLAVVVADRGALVPSASPYHQQTHQINSPSKSRCVLQ